MGVKTISISTFKARCLRLLSDLEAGGEPILVTKRGKPIARVLGLRERPAGSWLGSFRGTATIEGDLTEPVEPAKNWEATAG